MYKAVIIDDEPWTRNVIKSLGQWERLGIEIVGEASDGEMGWSLIKNIYPDIVITDVRMPHLSGLDLIQLIRAESMKASVIVISGYDDYDYVRQALKLGVADYLLKPIKPEELNRQLENCITLLENNATLPQLKVDADFPPDEWGKEYQKILEKLEIQLQLGASKDVLTLLNHLQAFVQEKEGNTPAKFIQIGIYYALLGVLQKYILNIGFTKKDIFQNTDSTYVFNRDSKLEEIIIFFQKLYSQTLQYVDEHTKKKNRLDTDSVCRYLKEHYTDGITLEGVADHFHISKEYLSKMFKNDQQIGFTDYVLKLRMERAKELITVYHAPLKEVGAIVGYIDQAHFYKNFKKYYGITPGEMRESLKSDNK
ncbi:MAG: response regulator [Pseudobutyrivibrio sp.]|nr:response regulator [Pseudobutyrivibrio sp.]